MQYLTSQIANILGVHPNTVRLYEKLNLISAVSRDKRGYRIFSDKHLDEMKFARIILPGPYPVDKELVLQIIYKYTKQDYETALSYTYQYYDGVNQEKLKTIKALEVLDKWEENLSRDYSIIAYTRKELSKICNISLETLRTWERASLISSIKIKNKNQYSVYEYEKVMIIYLLRKAGFSIQSLYEFFNRSHYEIPSNFFKEIYKDDETICQTNEWMNFLDKHIEKAKKIMKILENRIHHPL